MLFFVCIRIPKEDGILMAGILIFGISFVYMGNFLYLCNRFEVKDEMVRVRRGNDSKK